MNFPEFTACCVTISCLFLDNVPHLVEEFCGRGPEVFPTFGRWNLLVPPHENGTVVNGHRIESAYKGGNENLKGSLVRSLGRSLVAPQITERPQSSYIREVLLLGLQSLAGTASAINVEEEVLKDVRRI